VLKQDESGSSRNRPRPFLNRASQVESCRGRSGMAQDMADGPNLHCGPLAKLLTGPTRRSVLENGARNDLPVGSIEAVPGALE
jgi:hypothetical protein